MGNPNNYEGGFHFVTYRHRKYDNSEREMGGFRNYINYMESGSGRISMNSEVFEVKTGDLFFIPMDVPYSAFWLDNAVVRSCGFRLFPEARNARYGIQQLPRQFVPEFLQITLESQPDSVTLGRFYTLLGKLLPHMKAEAVSSENKLLEKLSLYVWRYPGCHVDDLARHCGMSKSTLYSTLWQLAGKTPHAFKLDIQLEKAKNYLLTTKASIHLVSEEACFCNAAYFRKVFKEATGMTPSEFRKKKRSQ